MLKGGTHDDIKSTDPIYVLSLCYSVLYLEHVEFKILKWETHNNIKSTGLKNNLIGHNFSK